MMQTNEELFQNLYFNVFNIYDEYHSFDDLIENGKWFYNGYRTSIKFKGSMVKYKKDPKNVVEIPYTECDYGWFWNGVCAKYDNSCNRYFYGDILNGWESGFGFDESYFGEFEKGRWHGFGCLMNVSNIYFGEFKNDEFCGRGMFLEIYEGQIMKTMCHTEEDQEPVVEGFIIDNKVDLSKFHTIIQKYLSSENVKHYKLRLLDMAVGLYSPPNISLVPNIYMA